jgi:zinc transport system substrate-binding protein
MRYLALILAAAALAAALAPAGAHADKPVVFTTNYPLYYFASRIAGDAAEVILPVPEDIDPAYWSPGPEDIAAMQKADLIMLNGAGYEKWIDKAALSEYRIVNTSESFRDRYIKVRGQTTHSHGPGGEHSHSGVAFTTWLDHQLALKQAEAIYAALLKKMPEQEKALTKNFDDLKKDLVWIDEAFESVVGAGKQGQPVIASHPVYQYLTRRYNLNFGNVHWEPGDYPTEDQWKDLDSRMESYNYTAKWMIWEAQPLEKTAKKLEERGITSVVFSPAANRPAEGDYIDVMKANYATLQKVYD